jgi:hypothetical protein
MTDKKTEQPIGKEAEEHIEHDNMHSETPKLGQPQTTPTQAKYKRTVIIALDHSPHSEKALQWAMDNLIRLDGSDLVVLTTVREPVLVPGAYGTFNSIVMYRIHGFR